MATGDLAPDYLNQSILPWTWWIRSFGQFRGVASGEPVYGIRFGHIDAA